jgi:hypothetical protein
VLASPDGELLYYRRIQNNGIYQIRPDGSGDEVAIPTARGEVIPFLTCAVTTSGLWFVSGPSGTLRMLRFADHRIVDRATLDWRPFQVQLSISPDEHFALVTKPDLGGTDLWMVKNFR